MTEPDSISAGATLRVIQAHLTNAVDILAAFNYVKADARVGFSLAACCAMVENESGGRNIFGGDPGGNALPRAWYETEVTRPKYLVYKARRNAGMTPNGVGPCQLTNATLQKAAEKAGGCWKPLYNMRVGFVFLKQLFEAHGSALGGFTAYNGSGPAAERYGEMAVARMNTWQSWFNAGGAPVEGAHFAHVDAAYARAEKLIGTPYVFGGGHPGFGPSGSPLKGEDCSGGASDVLHAGGLLPASSALDTAEFLHWGAPGPGKYLTVWVRNDAIQEHCFLDFHGRPKVWERRYWQAPHTGERIEWFSAPSFTGFHARHWPGT